MYCFFLKVNIAIDYQREAINQLKFNTTFGVQKKSFCSKDFGIKTPKTQSNAWIGNKKCSSRDEENRLD